MERTVVNISSKFSKIEIEDQFLFLGSCFANNIGSEFIQHKLNASVNPFGVIFHPIALANLIDRALINKPFESSDFFEFNDYWFSYELSGACAQFTLLEAIDFANQKLNNLKNYLTNTNRLFLTFGSAIQRSFKGMVVANCHKQSSEEFERGITTPNELASIYNELLKKIKSLNPNLNVYLTVSPVRHSKEGLIDNNRSKASLLLACQLIEANNSFVEYLPIYELVMDELRDYSFFKQDLVHPNDQVITEIWKRFLINLTTVSFQNYIAEVESLLRSLNHKSLYPKSKKHKEFLMKLAEKIEAHANEYTKSWTADLEDINNRLINMA